MIIYEIYKKRDGQSFKLFGEITAPNFDMAKKKFASKLTGEDYLLFNNIIGLSKEVHGVDEDGLYDLDKSIIIEKEDPENTRYMIPDYANSDMELHCSKEAIEDGFDTWSEDVYTWELRDYTERRDR